MKGERETEGTRQIDNDKEGRREGDEQCLGGAQVIFITSIISLVSGEV